MIWFIQVAKQGKQSCNCSWIRPFFILPDTHHRTLTLLKSDLKMSRICPIWTNLNYFEAKPDITVPCPMALSDWSRLMRLRHIWETAKEKWELFRYDRVYSTISLLLVYPNWTIKNTVGTLLELVLGLIITV